MVEALFYAFFVGTGLGFLYDLMRFFRLSFGGSLFFDLLFWLITSFVSFSYLLIFNDGAIKGIFLAFIFVGFTVYIISIGKISLPLEKRIAKKVLHIFFQGCAHVVCTIDAAFYSLQSQHWMINQIDNGVYDVMLH